MVRFLFANWEHITLIATPLYFLLTAFVVVAPPHLPTTADGWYCWMVAGLRQFINIRQPHIPTQPPPQPPLSPGQPLQ